MTIDEHNIVVNLKKRNEEALNYVIDQYGGLIKSIVSKYLYNLESVQEECIDDILLAVWDNIDKFSQEKNSFKNWLATVAKYKSIDYKRKYLKLLNQDNIEYANLESSLNVEKTVIENELSYELESLLNNLNEQDKELFTMHYIKEEDIASIAKSMGVNKSVIYNRLSRGRKKLKSLWRMQLTI